VRWWRRRRMSRGGGQYHGLSWVSSTSSEGKEGDEVDEGKGIRCGNDMDVVMVVVVVVER